MLSPLVLHADPRSFKKLFDDGYDDENAQSQTYHRIESSHPSREKSGAGNHRKEGRPRKGFFQACERRLAPGKERSYSREKKKDQADRNVDFVKEGRADRNLGAPDRIPTARETWFPKKPQSRKPPV